MDNIKCRVKVLRIEDDVIVDTEEPIYLGNDVISIREAIEFEKFIKNKRIDDGITGEHEYHSSNLEATGDKEFADQWFYVILVKPLPVPIDIEININRQGL